LQDLETLVEGLSRDEIDWDGYPETKAFVLRVTDRLGQGTDDNPFFLCLTTKYMLQKYVEAKERLGTLNNLLLNLADKGGVMFMTDDTYKVSSCGYVIMSCGVADLAGKYHPILVCVLSHQRADDYALVVKQLKNFIGEIFDIEMKPAYVMADASDALRNGMSQVWHPDEVKYVMCYMHVQKAIKDRLQDKVYERVG
jgi:hypothetical protein